MVPHERDAGVIGRLVSVALVAAVAAWALTRGTRRYALSHAVIDVPNPRSSHQVPTPRGGGLAIVAVFLCGLLVLWVAGFVPDDLTLALAGGGALVALVGWQDDRGEVAARWRLAAHLVAAIWTVWWLGGMPTLAIGARTANLGLGGAVLATLAITWAVNLYNFMDGIDGIAAGEALVAAVIAAALLAPRDPALALLAALVAGGAAGFLPWNWSPARIFMGDVGSGFLGYLFGALALAGERSGGLPAVLWVLLLGVFFVDATLTLVTRMVRGERWYAAHRTHAYQRSVQRGWSHARVTGCTLGLTALLGLLVWLCLDDPGRVPLALGVATVGLGALYGWVVTRSAPGAGRA
jgi:Fuc2NAc and GlcNAc transferase